MQGIHAVIINIYNLNNGNHYNSSCFSFSVFGVAVDDSVSADVEVEAVDAVEDDVDTLGLGTLGCFFDVNFRTYQISVLPFSLTSRNLTVVCNFFPLSFNSLDITTGVSVLSASKNTCFVMTSSTHSSSSFIITSTAANSSSVYLGPAAGASGVEASTAALAMVLFDMASMRNERPANIACWKSSTALGRVRDSWNLRIMGASSFLHYQLG
jgi:hypothetical protein